MASDMRTSTEPRFSELVTGILHDVQDLIKQQTALLQAEIREDYRKTKEAAVSLVCGVAIATLGSVLLALMMVHLIAWAAPTWPLWVCYAIVGGTITGLGGTLYYVGHERFKTFNPLPDKTVEVMKENVQWIVNRK